MIPMHDTAQIMIVDDDPLAIQTLNEILTRFGNICFTTSGQEALLLAQAKPVDLVLLDAQMPVLDGFATCRLLKRDHPDLVVIFVTASSGPASEIAALEAGAVDFITKPINPAVVRARVGTQLLLKQQTDLLRRLVKSDPLTGIANRRALEEQAGQEWRRARRNQTPLAVLMIDIDHFKAYNDHYGHLKGDECLRQVAQAITASVTRAGDLVARFGGEEFVVLLPECASQQAVAVAEKIRKAVHQMAIPHVASTSSDCVTISVGVAVGIPRSPMAPATARGTGVDCASECLEDLLNRADAGLYRAKQDGRDRVVLELPAAGEQ